MMVKRVALFCFAVLLVSVANGQEKNCSAFHAGSYVIHDADVGDVFIKRNKKYQIEKSGKSKSKYSIEWVNNCTYALRLVKTNDASIRKYFTEKVVCKIIETGAGYHIVEAKFASAKESIQTRIENN